MSVHILGVFVFTVGREDVGNEDQLFVRFNDELVNYSENINVI